MFGLSWEEEKEFHHQVGLAMLILTVPCFLLLYFLVDSPWGKHAPSKASESINMWFLGPSLNAKVSWVLFESPNLIWSLYCFLNRDAELLRGWNVNAILLSMFVAHYVNRTIIFPIRLSSKTKPVPLAVVLSALLFTGTNGYLQAQNLCQFQQYPPGYHSSPRFLLGVSTFLTGVAINLHSDSVLRRLRKPGETGYKIPRGGFFEKCSCPHHFGEIVEWGGFAIACDSMAAFSFWVFTCSNLIPRAVSHHRWYRSNFKDYPRHRTAVIPFLW